MKNQVINKVQVKILVFAVMCQWCYNTALAGYGTTGAQILELNSPARIAAMGNAFAGLADDLNAVVYNPAGLIQLYGTELQFSHLIYYMDSALSSLTFGQKVGKAGLGFKIKIFSADDTYRDSLGYNEKKFKITYVQCTFGAGYPVYQRHSVGAAVNVVSENFALGSIAEYGEDKKDTAAGFDIGWHYRGYRGDSFGVVIKNIGNGVKIGDKSDEMPLKYVLGGGHRMGRFMFAWEMFTGVQADFGWQCGAEADINGFKFRGGFMYITNPDVTVGFGVPYRNWLLDYAFFPHQDLGVAHRLSLGVYF